MNRIHHWEHLAFFRGMPLEILQLFDQNCSLLEANANQIIISHTEPSTDVFIVVSGTLNVQIFAENGKAIFYREIKPGDCVGELSAIDGAPRSASVLALTDCQVLVAPAKIFWEALRSCPALMERQLIELSAKVRGLTEQVFELTALDVNSRVISELWRMTTHEVEVDGEIIIDPAPTHETIANRVGTSREAVTRTLNWLEQLDMISKSRGRIVIKNIAQMSRLIAR